MKRIAAFLLVLVVCLFPACRTGQTSDVKAKALANSFITKIYTVNAEDAENFGASSTETSDASFKTYMTADGYSALINNRLNSQNIYACNKRQLTLSVKEVQLTDESKDKNTIQFNYTANITAKQIDKSSDQQSGSAGGIITLTLQNSQWKVSAFKIIDNPDFLT